MSSKIAYLWDYDIDEDKLKDILAGKLEIGRINKQWANIRLLEYAPYKDIIKLIGYREIVKIWPKLRGYIRSDSRKRGFDFLVEWLTNKHLEKI
jgi:hypothetical protein